MPKTCSSCRAAFADGATRCPRCGADAGAAQPILAGAERDIPRPGYGELGRDEGEIEGRFRFGALVPFFGIGLFAAIGALLDGRNGASMGAVIGLVFFALIAPLISR